MDYKTINDTIIKYESLTPEEVQKQIAPIIKSYDRKYLSDKTGIAPDTLINMTKRIFVDMDKKPSFTTYIKIMAMEINDGTAPTQQRKRILTEAEIEERRQKREEEKMEKMKIRETKKEATRQRHKEYAKTYYRNVTKPKRKAENKTR